MESETSERWKLLCEQATKEQDHEKFLLIIKEVNRLLSEKEHQSSRVSTLHRLNLKQSKMPDAPYEHTDIRHNPDLQEWFCAKCGATSDHTLKEDALAELSAFECSLFGATTKRLSEKERDLRAYHLSKVQKPEDEHDPEK